MIGLLLNTLYQLLITVVSIPVAACFTLHPRGRKRVQERLGFWGSWQGKGAGNAQWCWFHGASVGEVNSLLPILERIKAANPTVSILLTSGSPEGVARGAGHADSARVLPFDSLLWYLIAFRKARVVYCLFGETELWPGLLWYLRLRSIPHSMVNAVISNDTASRYRRLRGLLKPFIRELPVFAADNLSAERLIDLGVSAEFVKVNGNAKYDNAVKSAGSEKPESELVRSLASLWPDSEGQVVCFGSIWPEEMAVVGQAIRRLLSSNASVKIILAVRHVQKTAKLCESLKSEGIDYVLASEGISDTQSGVRCVVVDMMGVLLECYQFSALSLVGGSFADGIGGHNPLEPAAYSKPTAMGQFAYKQESILQELVERGGGAVLGSADEVVTWAEQLLGSSELRTTQGRAAHAVWSANQGAADRIVEAVDRSFAKSGGTENDL